MNTLKKPGNYRISIVYEHSNGEPKVAQIEKTSFKLTKDVREHRNFTEIQLVVHTTVMDSLRAAARKCARLGISNSKDAKAVFEELVDEYIYILKKAGPKANYFPVAMKSGNYRAFFEAQSAGQSKRAFEDPDSMEQE